MRKITQEASHAFDHGYDYKGSNTKVIDGALFLFGHKIAEYESLFKNDGNNNINITNCGYFTATTKERLNGLQGVHIQQKAGVWFLNGQEWNGEWITIKRD